MRLGKKGDEKVLSVWWFLILVIIAAAIVAGVLVFYGAKINMKKAEGIVMNEKIANCIVKGGYLQVSLDNLQDFDFFNNCHLDENVIRDPSNYYFEIFIKNLDTGQEKKIKKGNPEYEQDCRISSVTIAKYYPRCAEFKFYALTKNKEKLIISILAGSNQEQGR